MSDLLWWSCISVRIFYPDYEHFDQILNIYAINFGCIVQNDNDAHMIRSCMRGGTCSTILWRRTRSRSMILMATLSPVSRFLANLTLAKLPSPSVFPISYFPTRVRVPGAAMLRPLSLSLGWSQSVYENNNKTFIKIQSMHVYVRTYVRICTQLLRVGGGRGERGEGWWWWGCGSQRDNSFLSFSLLVGTVW